MVIGHSFGGKVALHFHMMASTPPDRTWILDSHLATFDIKVFFLVVFLEIVFRGSHLAPLDIKVLILVRYINM